MEDSHGRQDEEGVDGTRNTHGGGGEDDDESEEELPVDRVTDLASHEAEE